MSLLSGGYPSSTDLAPLAALGTAWTSYNPVWTATTTNPAIGNGAITARYLQAGKLVVYTGRILMGSTTTFGSGNWLISMPLAARDGTMHVGSALMYDASAQDHAGIVWLQNSSTMYITYAAGTEVSATNPQTWASGDQLRWSFTYETP